MYDAPEQEGDGDPSENKDMAENVKTELANIEAFPDAAPGKRYEVVIDMVHDKEVEFHVEGEVGEKDEEKAPEMAMAGGDEGGEENMMS